MADVSAFFTASVAEAKKRVGASGRLYVAGQEEASQRGLPLPSLASRYLFHSHILPFGKILNLSGAKASMKSAFGFSLGAMACEWGGGFHLVETEAKLNEEYMNSFFKPELRGRISVDYVDTLEDAQSCVTTVIKRYMKIPKEDRFPLVIGIDSLAGSGTASEYEKMNKSGHSERNFPEAALLWSPYFKKLSSDLADLDILVYFTNHRKEKTSEGAGFGKSYTKPGGVAQDFHSAQSLVFAKKANINLVSKQGKMILITSEKCGLGPDNRKIEVPVLWDFEEDENGEPHQVTKWAWDIATAKLLVSTVLSKNILEKLDVTANSGRYSSKELGVVGLTDEGFGDVVINSDEYCEKFRKLCGYRKWTTIGTKPTGSAKLKTKKKGGK